MLLFLKSDSYLKFGNYCEFFVHCFVNLSFFLFLLYQKVDVMTIKQLIKLEDKAKEVWVISPSLHYDVDNEDFTELVSVNLGEKTKYRYIVPATKQVEKNIKIYKKKYKLKEQDIQNNFLLLPCSEFNPFIQETAIYNANANCVACSAPALEDNNDVIQYNEATSLDMAKAFSELWMRYKRTKP